MTASPNRETNYSFISSRICFPAKVICRSTVFSEMDKALAISLLERPCKRLITKTFLLWGGRLLMLSSTIDTSATFSASLSLETFSSTASPSGSNSFFDRR